MNKRRNDDPREKVSADYSDVYVPGHARLMLVAGVRVAPVQSVGDTFFFFYFFFSLRRTDTIDRDGRRRSTRARGRRYGRDGTGPGAARGRFGTIRDKNKKIKTVRNAPESIATTEHSRHAFKNRIKLYKTIKHPHERTVLFCRRARRESNVPRRTD